MYTKKKKDLRVTTCGIASLPLQAISALGHIDVHDAFISTSTICREKSSEGGEKEKNGDPSDRLLLSQRPNDSSCSLQTRAHARSLLIARERVKWRHGLFHSPFGFWRQSAREEWTTKVAHGWYLRRVRWHSHDIKREHFLIQCERGGWMTSSRERSYFVQGGPLKYGCFFFSFHF